jgi:hypothetical protein
MPDDLVVNIELDGAEDVGRIIKELANDPWMKRLVEDALARDEVLFEVVEILPTKLRVQPSPWLAELLVNRK